MNVECSEVIFRNCHGYERTCPILCFDAIVVLGDKLKLIATLLRMLKNFFTGRYLKDRRLRKISGFTYEHKRDQKKLKCVWSTLFSGIASLVCF